MTWIQGELQLATSLASPLQADEQESPEAPIPRLRWWIGGLLFASTIVNLIDRQSLSAIAPILKVEYRWSNTDFAIILIAFRVAYTLMQGVGGRLLDWLGTRKGLSLTVAFYSLVAALTSTARGLAGFSIFRFLLGAGEGPNWPGATKAVSEWFPPKERAWGVALFSSGGSVGGAIAPLLVLYVYRTFHSWRPIFLITGSLGFAWLMVWRRLYRPPGRHPRISFEELQYIRGGREPVAGTPGRAVIVGWGRLLRFRQTWGIVMGRFLLDPYWFLMSEWLAIYLVSKGFRLEQSILGFWLPFLAADLGNFAGGCFQLLDFPWLAGGPLAAHSSAHFWTEHAGSGRLGVHIQILSARRPLRLCHICIQCLFNHVSLFARRRLQHGRSGLGEWTGRNRRWNWNSHFNLFNWSRQ